MPNWCFIQYKIVGDKEQVARLSEAVNELDRNPEPLVENEFHNPRNQKGDNRWLGCLVTSLGGNWSEVPCRGRFTDHSFQEGTTNEGVLDLHVEYAYSEPSGFRRFLLDKFPGCRILFVAESDDGSDYETNDAEGEFFKDRFVLDFEDVNDDCGTEYFPTLQALADYIVGKKMAESVGPDYDEIREALDEWENAEDGRFYSLHKYGIVK